MPYGDMKQWQRRRKKALREGSPAFTGLQCRKCVGAGLACDECAPLLVPWSVLHFGQPGRPGPMDDAILTRIAAR